MDAAVCGSKKGFVIIPTPNMWFGKVSRDFGEYLQEGDVKIAVGRSFSERFARYPASSLA